MKSSIQATVHFPFAHFVVDPHYHPDATVELVISSELRVETGHVLHMTGADGVAARFELERLLGAHLAGRMLVWEHELDTARSMQLQRPSGVVAPILVETVWPVRPTIEAVTMFVALMCVDAVAATDDPTARIEKIMVAETERTAAVVHADALDELLAAASGVFGRLNS